ncbi:hypothetical protein AJ80_08851 [Polytolypa hystricis UAMH7299]|uniref:Peptidase S8/S53 domain-containing protein n=1 Tax=Polytolypa hystricis (strain UAMH7299) TaxID=1447883 RepID=A0A2B7X126_POLH7|nr:hypothetical protein AJ80_08851 [Polytolypa hystricis UAMH7299]
MLVEQHQSIVRLAQSRGHQHLVKILQEKPVDVSASEERNLSFQAPNLSWDISEAERRVLGRTTNIRKFIKNVSSLEARYGKPEVKVVVIHDGIDPTYEHPITDGGSFCVPGMKGDNDFYDIGAMGTHTASVIHDVCLGSMLYVARVGTENGMDFSIDVVEWAINKRVNIISISGDIGQPEDSQRYQKFRDAITAAIQHGISIFCSATNRMFQDLPFDVDGVFRITCFTSNDEDDDGDADFRLFVSRYGRGGYRTRFSKAVSIAQASGLAALIMYYARLVDVEGPYHRFDRTIVCSPKTMRTAFVNLSRTSESKLVIDVEALFFDRVPLRSDEAKVAALQQLLTCLTVPPGAESSTKQAS